MLRIRLSSLLAFLFLVQLVLPLVVFGSTALGAFIWVFVSFCFFILPCLLLPNKIELNGLPWVVLAFLLPAIFVGISNFNNLKVDPRSIADLIRAPYFLAAFLAGCKLAGARELVEECFSRVFKWFLFLVILYLFGSYILRDMVDDLELLYGKIDNVVSARLFVPFPNPYDLALFCALPFFYFLFLGRMLPALGVFVVLLATQSRTGIILLAIGLIIGAATSLVVRRRMVILVLFVGVAIVTALLFIVDINMLKASYLVANTAGLLDGNSTTLSRRFAQWAYLTNVPELGFGTVRSADLVIENAIIYEVYRTGVFGLYAIALFYFLPLAIAVMAILVPGVSALVVAMAIFVILTVVGFNSSVFIYQPKLSLIYWIAVGFLYSVTSGDVRRAFIRQGLEK